MGMKFAKENSKVRGNKKAVLQILKSLNYNKATDTSGKSSKHIKTSLRTEINSTSNQNTTFDPPKTAPHVNVTARNVSCGRKELPCCNEHWPAQKLIREGHSYLTGLACRTNKSLTFHTLDTAEHDFIARSVGIQHNPALMIVDAAREQYFIMRKEIAVDRSSIAAFILNFTAGILKRHMRTTEANVTPCHSSTGSIRITELTSTTFHKEVIACKQDVVVMFYTPWCGFCKHAHHVFLQVAAMMKGEQVKFARINGDENDLPWEYTPEGYPSFLLFPARRKSQSIAYSND